MDSLSQFQDVRKQSHWQLQMASSIEAAVKNVTVVFKGISQELPFLKAGLKSVKFF